MLGDDTFTVELPDIAVAINGDAGTDELTVNGSNNADTFTVSATAVNSVGYGTIETLYRIDRFPTYFLIDRAGTIACSRCPLPKIQDAQP